MLPYSLPSLFPASPVTGAAHTPRLLTVAICPPRFIRPIVSFAHCPFYLTFFSFSHQTSLGYLFCLGRPGLPRQNTHFTTLMSAGAFRCQAALRNFSVMFVCNLRARSRWDSEFGQIGKLLKGKGADIMCVIPLSIRTQPPALEGATHGGQPVTSEPRASLFFEDAGLIAIAGAFVLPESV